MRHTEFQSHLTAVLASKGALCLPNVVEATSPQEALNWIAGASGPASKAVDAPYMLRVRNFDPPKGHVTHQIAYHPKIFLNTRGMASQFEGSGVILIQTDGKATAFKFTMCEHDWNTSGGNPSRGWHPCRCRKCGFDASIDSGD